ncbi:MAG: hypothetical protein D6723_00695 [Acidobacteria bacterium]|nr:MAG: hypothetical protein D6723_00695 [Acidobacteriota bacterium]
MLPLYVECAVKKTYTTALVIVGLVAFGSGVWAGNELSSRQARRLIAHVGGIDLDPEHVHIRRIDVGLGGNDAVVEALVQTAFKFTQTNGRWEVTHIRTGDRRWESVELVTTAIRREKIRRTQADLLEVARALEAYRRDHEGYPQVADFASLIDVLLPQYLHRIIREDYWHQSYHYTVRRQGYQLRSWGPDRKRGSDDDIIVENGQLVLPVAG